MLGSEDCYVLSWQGSAHAVWRMFAGGLPLGHTGLVVDVATAPDKKACVLDAAYELADAKLTHGDIVTLSR